MTTYRVGSLFSGYGGLDIALSNVIDTELSWVCDNDRSTTTILKHHYPNTPNLGDITRANWNEVPDVDVITAGFPCQDISHSGKKAGITKGKNSGLWRHVIESTRALQPRLVVLENVAAITGRGLDTVAGDLAAIGFDAEWCTLRASDIGAPHRRDRWFAIAWPTANTIGQRLQRSWTTWDWRNRPTNGSSTATDTKGIRRSQRRTQPTGIVRGSDAIVRSSTNRWGQYALAIERWQHITGQSAPESSAPGRNGSRLSARFVEWMMGLEAGWVTDVPGLSRNQKLHALGNGVVPQQAETAIRHLITRSTES